MQNVNLHIRLTVVQCNHSKGQESCDGRARDELDIPSTISQIPQGGRVAATGGPVHVPGVLSIICPPPHRTKGGKEMSINELESKCRELRQLQALIDEAQAEVETIKDAIKAAMGPQETVQAGEYKITWKPVTSIRLDATALRKALPDVAERFTRTTTIRRFTVA